MPRFAMPQFTMLRRHLFLCLGLLALTSWVLPAQELSSEKNFETNRAGRGPAVPLSHDKGVIEIRKVKGTVGKVDLELRTITIVTGKKKIGDLVLSFSQPEGREQIKVSSKAAKLLGKKNMKLEEVRPGSKVKIQYYPSMGQFLELIIEKPAS